jgi:hypothetical protein
MFVHTKQTSKGSALGWVMPLGKAVNLCPLCGCSLGQVLTPVSSHNFPLKLDSHQTLVGIILFHLTLF